MKIRSLLLAATILALPAAVQAGEVVNGVYVGLGAGFDLLNSLSVGDSTEHYSDGTTWHAKGSNNLESNGGWAVLGSVGYGFGNGVRAEIEGNFRQNHVHLGNSASVIYTGPEYGSTNFPINGGGNWQQAGVMVNALYDFATVAPWVTPYVGIGFGYIWNEFQNGAINYPGGPNIDNYRYSGSKGAGAGQFILGAAFPVGVPGLSLTTEFRFLGEFGGNTFTGSLTNDTTGRGVSTKFGTPTNESFLIGLRYAFNAAPEAVPAPAPVAAPAPAAARTYLVFFDWDRADLNARARQIIAEAAQASSHVQLTQIEVSGYADRTGTAQYNVGLSRRRADNVAAELVRLGVPKNVIAIQAFGDTHLLVPTAEGVREPQNRRVEIVLK